MVGGGVWGEVMMSFFMSHFSQKKVVVGWWWLVVVVGGWWWLVVVVGGWWLVVSFLNWPGKSQIMAGEVSNEVVNLLVLISKL